jgi:hypothetical protein
MFNLFIYFILINFIINNISNITNNYIDNQYYIRKSTNEIFDFNRKNLILGMIQSYTIEMILPFFNSMIEANINNCDVVMFVSNVSEILIRYLNDIGVLVYRIPEKYNDISCINLRWKLYTDFLNENKDKYNLVISIDTRDSIIQNDIFKYYSNYSSFLGVAIEDGNLNEKVNRKWIINFVGKKKYKIIKNERIICVGTIWGTSDKFLEFSNIFWNKLNANKKYIEQGIANYLFYYEKIFNDCLIKSDNFGPVMTIGLTKRKKITLDKRNKILNFRGEIASIVHQYDRKLDILNLMKYKYLVKIRPNINNQTN